jgi:hypothetical protein
MSVVAAAVLGMMSDVEPIISEFKRGKPSLVQIHGSVEETNFFVVQKPKAALYEPRWWEQRIRVLLSNAEEQEIIVRESLGASGPEKLRLLAESSGLYL